MGDAGVLAEPEPAWRAEIPDFEAATRGATPFARVDAALALARRRHHQFARELRTRGLMELSGALGDLGTLLPLLLACADAGVVKPASALLWMGAFNVLSGYQWDLPMPVQPMKAIAAAAITEPARHPPACGPAG